MGILAGALFVSTASEIEVLGAEDPLRCDVALIGLPQQPGNQPVCHHGCRLPSPRFQRWVQVRKLRLEPRVAGMSPALCRCLLSIHVLLPTRAKMFTPPSVLPEGG